MAADAAPIQVFVVVADVVARLVAAGFAIPSLPVDDVPHVVFGLAPIVLDSNVKRLVHLASSDVAVAIASVPQLDVSA